MGAQQPDLSQKGLEISNEKSVLEKRLFEDVGDFESWASSKSVTGVTGFATYWQENFNPELPVGLDMNKASKDPRFPDKDLADTAGLHPPTDLDGDFGLDKHTIDGYIARSLERQIHMLTANFWGERPAEIESANLKEDELTLSVKLPFLSPPPSGESGDPFATQEDVDEIRRGFITFLEEQPLINRRLANLFYSEFYRYLLGHAKIFRFNQEIRAKIEQAGERRLGGRPSIPIPKSREKEVEQQLTTIYTAVLDIQQKVAAWKLEESPVTKEAIIDRLKVEYDRERHPWSRYAFQNVNMLPGKRAYGRRPGQSESRDQLTQPSILEPERWSAPDLAVVWTQIWFYAEYGQQYDRRAIRKLLVTS